CAAAAFSVSFCKRCFGYVQHQFLRACALRAQKSFDVERAVERGGGNHAGLALKRDRFDFRFHLAILACLIAFRLVAQPELHDCDSAGSHPQRPHLGQPAGERDAVLPAQAGAAGASAGFVSPALNSPFSISERDFSSFIIGDGAVTALGMRTIRWRSTASLNLNECSSSPSVSPSHSMFIST